MAVVHLPANANESLEPIGPVLNLCRLDDSCQLLLSLVQAYRLLQSTLRHADGVQGYLLRRITMAWHLPAAKLRRSFTPRVWPS
ncbi:hypothetical protein WJX84_001758 [Apatococcus fuscideae]|uniref:Uncharacterized protein n=1 Tax=Apatococcus fuscideae TaxID=2026836 RepID=A0AAW1SVJ8_9CHLO